MSEFTVTKEINPFRKVFFLEEHFKYVKVKLLFLYLAVALIFLPAAFSHAILICPECQYKTIKSALNAMKSNPDLRGQPIELEEGGYSETGLEFGPNTTQQLSSISGNPENTTINGGGVVNGIFGGGVIHAFGATIQGITITGGNNPTASGGGISGSGYTLDNVIVEFNSANTGGGVGSLSDVTIVNSKIRNNTAQNGAGGIYNWGGDLTIKNTRIEDNNVTGDSTGRGSGGGIFSSYYSNTRIENSIIAGNQASGSYKNEGGGVWIGGDTATLINVTLSNNNAEPGSSGSSGGGIYMSSKWYAHISGGSISGNTASRGAGVFWAPGGLAAVSLATSINGNVTTMPVGSGGGIYCSSPYPTTTLAGSITGNIPDDIVNCGTSFVPPPGTTRTTADNKQSGDSNDPVNTFTGELYNQYDLDVSLGGPMPLYFARYYSSGFKQVGIFANMGDNWRHNFDWELTAISSEMHIVDHQGRTIQFDKNGLSWDLAGKTDIPYELVENTGIYTLLDPHSQRSYVFNSAGQLTSILDGKGNEHTLSYANGPLTQVSDGLGRVLNFTYNASNYLITVDDGLGREVGFAYTDSYLTGVTDLLGNTTEYNYSTAHDNHLGMGLLASTVRPAGNTPFEQLVGVYSTAYNPQDGELYGLIRKTIAEGGGLYPVTGPNRGILLQAYDRPAHVLFADDGDAFISEDYAGVINRLEWQGISSVWVSGFHDDDDDPFGMTFAPPGYNGPNVNPGDILVSDRGSSGPDEIYAFSPDTAEGEKLVMPDPGTVEVEFFDLASSPGVVYTCDYLDPDNVYTLAPEGMLTALPLSEPILKMGSIVYDSVDNVMYVSSSETMSVYRIDPATGQVVLVSSGFANLTIGCLEIDPLTRRLWVTDNGYNRIYEISLQAEDSDRLGNITTYNYSQTWNDSLKASTQTNAAGNTFSFDYSGLNTTITDPLGNIRTHIHTATGELSKSQDKASQYVVIGSDTTGRRNSITDRLGDVTRMSYHQESGKLASKTNADDIVTSYSYTARATGSITQYDLTGITHADSATQSFAYDGNGNMTSHTDRGGNASSTTYNVNGQPLIETNKAGGVTINTYNSDGTPATVIDPNDNTTTFGYDSLRRLNLTTYADGSTESFTYDDLDQLLTTTYNGNTTTMDYDDNGNLISVTDPLNNTTTFTYDGNDRLLTTTDPNGFVVRKTYDALGRLETTTDENNNTITHTYDILGRLSVITDPNGNTNSFTYDAEGVIATTTDGLDNTTSFIADKMGRVTDVTTPMGHLSQIGFDQMGRVTSIIDPLGLTTTFNFDSMGLLSEMELPGGISASYTRNVLGQITTVTDPNGNDWLQRYDVQGRLISRSDPLGNTITTDHDNRSRISHVTYPGGLGGLDLGYDQAGNLTDADYSDGTTLDYTYGKNNRLIAANGITRSYDVNGRIIKSNGIDVARDPGGRITSMTLASGKNVTYKYHANNNLISVTDWTGGVTTFDYDAAGRLVSIVRPNGVNTTIIRDDDSRLTGISEGVISSIVITLDAAGQTTAATRNVPLSASAAALTAGSKTYDAASQVSDFTYDALGRLIDDGTRTYSWNLASRLTSVTESASTSFTYDGAGNRLSKSTGGVTRSYVWNYAVGLPSVSVEMLGAATLRYYIHTPGGRLIYSIEASDDSRRDHHYDEMGNTIFVTDNAGAVIASYAYSPYGKIVSSTGGLDNLFAWQGQYGVMDDGNGLYYMRARYYDSVTERFISRDPVESINPQDINPYQYASGNPLYFFDPVGLAPNEYNPEEFHGYERLGVLVRDSALGALPFELYNIVRMKRPETAAEWAVWGLKKVAGPAGAVAELGANIAIIIIDEYQNMKLHQGNLEAKSFMRQREIDAEHEARRVLIYKDFDKLTTMGSQARSILRGMALKKLIKMEHDLAAAKWSLEMSKSKVDKDLVAGKIKRLENKEWFLLNAMAAPLIPGEAGWSDEPSSNREAANEPTLGNKE